MAWVTVSLADGHSACLGSMDLGYTSHFHPLERVSFYSKDQQEIQRKLFWKRDVGVMGVSFLARPADENVGCQQVLWTLNSTVLRTS